MVEWGHGGVAMGELVEDELFILTELADDGDEFAKTLLGVVTADFLRYLLY